MNNVLPPQAGLVVNGVVYNYTVDKNTGDPLLVHIQNENAAGEGYIFRETDDWSGKPGSTINKFIRIENIGREYFGNGSIETEGVGSVSDARVAYTYKFNECYIPLSNPDCPGYQDALYDWLKENGLLDNPPQPGDPYYDEYVQASLNRETKEETEDEKNAREKEQNKEEEEDPIEALNQNIDVGAFVNGAEQAAMITQMSTTPQFDSYYNVAIQGGIYNEDIVLQDSTLPDNPRAMRSLASDATHKSMVRSQYEK